MSTVAEILAQMLDPNAETEKVAQVADTEVNEIQKLASEFGCTAEDVASVMGEIDEEEKTAEAEKTAEEAVYMGRFMARGFVDELNKLGSAGVGGYEPTTTDQGGNMPQDGSVTNRIADAISKTHGQTQAPKKEELKAAIKAQRANFQAAGMNAVAPTTALETEYK